MKYLLATTAAAVAFAVFPAVAQPPAAETTADGNVTVEGIAPSKVLGAIDTSKLVDQPPAPATGTLPQPRTEVTVATEVTETPTATIEKRTEVITPVSDRPAVNPENPIAPEVKAVVSGQARYTTADLVKAQHEAMLNTPASAPTKVITTTTVNPKTDG